MKGHRMSVLNRLRPVLLLAAIVALAPAVLGADPGAAPATPASPAASSGITDRLFLAFAQDAAIVQSQWWEGQLEFADGSSGIPVDVLLGRGVVAFRPVKSLEVGGRVGFGQSSASGTAPDGTGATDLDVYGKRVFSNALENTDFTAGLLCTVPTGDDTAGLGFNAFSTQAFGGVRFRMENVVIGGHVGFRFNGDGKFQGVDLHGKTSFELGGSALFPLANQVSFVGEIQYETARFESPFPGSSLGSDAAAQVLAGVNWTAFPRGTFRAAIGGGLTDGSPDFRVILGYAFHF
jgi:hypothetical protein